MIKQEKSKPKENRRVESFNINPVKGMKGRREWQIQSRRTGVH